MSLAIAAGETVAFVGETGAGKSTLVKLAARLYDPTAGRILVDGRPLVDLDLEAFRQQLGFVPQEAFLFTGTIRDNIAYARPTPPTPRWRPRPGGGGPRLRVPAAVGVPPAGGGAGRSLSAGQRQLIALARAQLVDPAILVLDEATASLDLATGPRWCGPWGWSARAARRAHRPPAAARRPGPTASSCWRRPVVEVGPHDELVARGGYASLWASYLGEAIGGVYAAYRA